MGGVYGNGTTESGLGSAAGTAGTARRHGQFAIPSGGTGEPGEDDFAECFRQDERADCASTGLTNATVGKWRRRFLEQDVSGLHDELRPGRPRPISDDRVAQLVRKTLETKPKGDTHWSIRQIAQQTRLLLTQRRPRHRHQEYLGFL